MLKDSRKRSESLEAYNQLVNGWVRDMQGWSVDGKIVVTGKVHIQLQHAS